MRSGSPLDTTSEAPRYMTSPLSNPAFLTLSAAPVASLAAFAAQFSLGRAGWLLAYLPASWPGPVAGLESAPILTFGLAAAVSFAATEAWPADGPLQRTHRHPDLPADHPHLRDFSVSGPGHTRRHDCHIDGLRPGWAGSAA